MKFLAISVKILYKRCVKKKSLQESSKHKAYVGLFGSSMLIFINLTRLI